MTSLRNCLLTPFLCLIIALLCSYFTHPQDNLTNLRHNYLRLTKDADRTAIEGAINWFNSTAAGLYNTSGLREEVYHMPARKFLRRKLFQDVQKLNGQGLANVFDKDRVSFDSIEYLGKRDVLVLTSETWTTMIQEYGTRRPLAPVSAFPLKVRYHLSRTPEGGWSVQDYDLFHPDENIPPLNRWEAL